MTKRQKIISTGCVHSSLCLCTGMNEHIKNKGGRSPLSSSKEHPVPLQERLLTSRAIGAGLFTERSTHIRPTGLSTSSLAARSLYALRYSRGFTLIFAVLIGSLLVAIAISISNIALKQLAISAVSRESQIAFYAADSGVECALFWDVHGPYQTPPFNFASPDNPSPSGTMSCGSGSIVPTSQSIGGGYIKNIFTVNYNGNPPSCAVVSLKKKSGVSSDSNVIDSYGINDCSATDNQYRVERALRVEYK